MTKRNPQPEHGWTCFHCGQTFLTRGAAADHFGTYEDAKVACQVNSHQRGLLVAWRRAEEEIARLQLELHDENGECARSYASLASTLEQSMVDAEVVGFEKGTRQMRAMLLNRAKEKGILGEKVTEFFKYVFECEI